MRRRIHPASAKARHTATGAHAHDAIHIKERTACHSGKHNIGGDLQHANPPYTHPVEPWVIDHSREKRIEHAGDRARGIIAVQLNAAAARFY